MISKKMMFSFILACTVTSIIESSTPAERNFIQNIFALASNDESGPIQIINSTDSNGRTLLDLVFNAPHTSLQALERDLEFFLEHDADINQTSGPDSETLLHMALYRYENNPSENNLDLIRFLLQNGADPNIENGSDQTANDLNRELIQEIFFEIDAENIRNATTNNA